MNLKNSKEIILNQALLIFGRLGFHKTTMADIASASKRGRRTIYTYFKNKEEVYEAVVEREIERIVQKLAQEMAKSISASEKLSHYISSRTQSILELTQNYDALKIAFINNYKWVEKIRQTLDIEEYKILQQILREGQEQQEFLVKDVEVTIKNLMLIIKGVELYLIKESNKVTSDQYITNIQHILLNGLKC